MDGAFVKAGSSVVEAVSGTLKVWTVSLVVNNLSLGQVTEKFTPAMVQSPSIQYCAPTFVTVLMRWLDDLKHFFILKFLIIIIIKNHYL